MIGDLYLSGVMEEYDSFLQECFKPYGITKENISEYADRITIDRFSPVMTIDGSVTVNQDVFFLDGQPIFSAKKIIKYEESAPGVYKATIGFEKGESQ